MTTFINTPYDPTLYEWMDWHDIIPTMHLCPPWRIAYNRETQPIGLEAFLYVGGTENIRVHISIHPGLDVWHSSILTTPSGGQLFSGIARHWSPPSPHDLLMEAQMACLDHLSETWPEDVNRTILDGLSMPTSHGTPPISLLRRLARLTGPLSGERGRQANTSDLMRPILDWIAEDPDTPTK